MPEPNRRGFAAGPTARREEDNAEEQTESADTQSEERTQRSVEEMQRTGRTARPVDGPQLDPGGPQDPGDTEPTVEQPPQETESDSTNDTTTRSPNQAPGGRFSPDPGQEPPRQPPRDGQPSGGDTDQPAEQPPADDDTTTDTGGGDGGVPWGSGPGGAVRPPDAGTGDDTDTGSDPPPGEPRRREDSPPTDSGGDDVLQPGETYVPDDEPGETGEIRETEDRNVGRGATGAVTPVGGRDRFREQRTPDSELPDPTPNREDFEVIQDIRANTEAGLDTEFEKVGPGAYLATFESGRQQLFTIGEVGEEAAENYFREQRTEARQEAATEIESQLAEQGIDVDLTGEDVVSTTTDGETVFRLESDVRSRIERQQAAEEIQADLADQGIDYDISPQDLNLEDNAYVLEPNVVDKIRSQQQQEYVSFLDDLVETQRRGYSQFRPDPDIDSFAQIRLEDRQRANRIASAKLFAGAAGMDQTTESEADRIFAGAGSAVTNLTADPERAEAIREDYAETIDEELTKGDPTVDITAEDVELTAVGNEIQASLTESGRAKVREAENPVLGDAVGTTTLFGVNLEDDIVDPATEFASGVGRGAASVVSFPVAAGVSAVGYGELGETIYTGAQQGGAGLGRLFTRQPVELAEGAYAGLQRLPTTSDLLAGDIGESAAEFRAFRSAAGSAAETQVRQTYNYATENPVAFASGVGVSLPLSYGAFRAASAIGPRANLATRAAIQPGEEVVFGTARATGVTSRVAGALPVDTARFTRGGDTGRVVDEADIDAATRSGRVRGRLAAMGDRVPEVGVRVDPDAPLLDVDPELRAAVSDVSLRGVGRGAVARVAGAGETVASRVRGLGDVDAPIESGMRRLPQTPSITGDVARQQAFLRGAQSPEVAVAERVAAADPSDLLPFGRGVARQRVRAVADRVQSGPGVSGDVALQQAFTRGSSLPFPGRSGLGVRRSDIDVGGRIDSLIESTTTGLVVRGDVVRQQAFTRGAATPEESVVQRLVEADPSDVLPFDAGTRLGALRDRVPSPTTVSGDVALQQAFTRGSRLPGPGRPGFDTSLGAVVDDLAGSARREATALRFDAAQLRDRFSTRFEELRDVSVKVGRPGRAGETLFESEDRVTVDELEFLDGDLLDEGTTRVDSEAESEDVVEEVDIDAGGAGLVARVETEGERTGTGRDAVTGEMSVESEAGGLRRFEAAVGRESGAVDRMLAAGQQRVTGDAAVDSVVGPSVESRVGVEGGSRSVTLEDIGVESEVGLDVESMVEAGVSTESAVESRSRTGVDERLRVEAVTREEQRFAAGAALESGVESRFEAFRDDGPEPEEYRSPVGGFADEYRVNPIERLGDVDFGELFDR